MDEEFIKSEIKLSDGSFEKIFAKGLGKQEVYSCFLCRVRSLSHDDNGLRIHAQGKKHRKRLNSVPDAIEFRRPFESLNNKNNINTVMKVSGCDKKQKRSFRAMKNNSKKSPPSTYENKKTIVSSTDLILKANEAGEQVYRREKYKNSIKLLTKKLLEDYKVHQKTPEDHPMYAKEWKKFWAHRYKELKVEGKVNPSDYDYKPEWVDFWMKRMKEILVETIKDKKIEILMKLKLPLDYEESLSDSSSDSSVDDRENSRKRSAERITNYEEISSESMSDDSECSYPLPPKHYRRSSSRDVVRYRDSSSAPSLSFEDNNEVTVVSICRLLSALESEVGSLSHKVLDLLSKAIALEKLKANSSDELLMTSENSIFLETVKEKMKGLLMIGALSPNKTAAVKKCIQNIAKLIKQTPVKEVEKEDAPMADEKFKMAVQVAEALRACGKEDCTPEELEVLVEMCLEVPTGEVDPPPVEIPPSTSNMNLLTDADLKILLDNFTDLVKNEQDQVIQFLSSLEKTEPMRVEALRQHVTMDGETGSSNSVIVELDDDSDDYNINETIASVLARAENRQATSIILTQDEQSLTDNILTFGHQHQMQDQTDTFY